MNRRLLSLGILAVMSSVALAEGEAAAPAADAAAPAGNALAARNKVAMCQGCHGQPGWRTAFPEVYSVPRLGGQNPRYIVAALKEYKSGERAFPTMQAVAASLSDQDMADIAAYYAAAAK